MKLTLIRHGITEGNAKHLYYGATDLPLSKEGIEMLKAAALCYDYPVAKHYCTSGMLRAEQTLQIIYGDIPHAQISDLREMDFGVFEMRGFYGDLEHDAAFRLWCQGDVEENVCPGGESARQMADRALRAITPIIEREEDTVCITHGGVIARLMMQWFPDDSGNPYCFTPDAGSGYQIVFQGTTPLSFRSIG
ncbi:MAG: histidine phosphatase family protein [Eubacteriales bacterium]|nr:histidine phosphatase family protein [Eubacteriales bacterium]